MEYFFLPGRLKTLSLVELNCVCENFLGSQYSIKDCDSYILLKTDLDELLVSKIFRRLGGFLKYGRIVDHNIDIANLVKREKVVFGISSYCNERYSTKDLKALSQKIKIELSDLKKKVRFVLPQKDTFLNCSQIIKNNLLEEGFELVLFKDSMGVTLGVQDIESFAFRDYGKPFVDSAMGVLPIKLSRIMINIAKISEGKSFWDPFCGSGNLLLEGLDLGYDVYGSDIDTRALEGCEKNIKWAIDNFDYKNKGKVFYMDILNPSPTKLDILKNISIGGIVCEPYMGEAQRKVLVKNKAYSLINQHLNLVKGLFETLEGLNIKEGIRVVIIFPEYKTREGWVSVDKNLLNFRNTKLIEKDLHWSRVNSIIKRLIFIFEYKYN